MRAREGRPDQPVVPGVIHMVKSRWEVCDLRAAQGSNHSSISRRWAAEAERAGFPCSPARDSAARLCSRAVDLSCARDTDAPAAASAARSAAHNASRADSIDRLLHCKRLLRCRMHSSRSHCAPPASRRVLRRGQRDHDGALIAHQVFLRRRIHLLERHGIFFVQTRVDQIGIAEFTTASRPIVFAVFRDERR